MCIYTENRSHIYTTYISQCMCVYIMNISFTYKSIYMGYISMLNNCSFVGLMCHLCYKLVNRVTTSISLPITRVPYYKV